MALRHAFDGMWNCTQRHAVQRTHTHAALSKACKGMQRHALKGMARPAYVLCATCVVHTLADTGDTCTDMQHARTMSAPRIHTYSMCTSHAHGMNMHVQHIWYAQHAYHTAQHALARTVCTRCINACCSMLSTRRMPLCQAGSSMP